MLFLGGSDCQQRQLLFELEVTTARLLTACLRHEFQDFQWQHFPRLPRGLITQAAKFDSVMLPLSSESLLPFLHL